MRLCFPFFFLIISVVLLFSSCEKDKKDRRIKDVNVYKELNLTRYRYDSLNRDGGYVHIPGGVEGIIVYRQNQEKYLAFERNCPYRPGKSCARVSVDSSGLSIIDYGCCNSRFDFTGSPVSGPANRPLKRYSTSLQGNRLIISNR